MITITNWSSAFENAHTRKLQRLGWFLSPSGCDSAGYRLLMRSGLHGLAALGLFQALAQALATFPAEIRSGGTFRRTGGGLMSLEDILDLARVSLEDPTAALDLLLQAGWITFATDSGPSPADLPTSSQSSPTPLPPSSQSSPGFVKGEGEGEGEDPPNPQGGDAGEILSRFWQHYPVGGRVRSSEHQVARAWRRIPASERPDAHTLLAALDAWKDSDHWAGGFVKSAHGFLSARLWASPPRPRRAVGIGFAPARPAVPEPADGIPCGPALAALFESLTP